MQLKLAVFGGLSFRDHALARKQLDHRVRNRDAESLSITIPRISADRPERAMEIQISAIQIGGIRFIVKSPRILRK